MYSKSRDFNNLLVMLQLEFWMLFSQTMLLVTQDQAAIWGMMDMPAQENSNLCHCLLEKLISLSGSISPKTWTQGWERTNIQT
jgi:hypothetical protein